MSNWTFEVKKALTVLWLRGDTCSMIALELNRAFGVRLSRNAVIGKVTRMGLPSRKVPVRAVTAHSIAARIRAERAKATPKPARIIPPPPLPKGAKRIPTPEEGLMTYAEHRDFRDCAMFCEGEDRLQGRVCGKPCAIGLTYCPSCLELVYQPAPKPKAKSAA